MRGKLLYPALFLLFSCLLPHFAAAEMILVQDGRAMAPIIMPAGVTADTGQAVRDLAGYIEKISGARPPVLEGRPDPLPESAVWVGYQPVLAELFPGTGFDFQHPEEVLLACDGQHLVIAGRDLFAGEKQLEHGTVNAVYEFLEKKLGVRWLWPTALGEDIVRQETIAFAPFEYRFHPQFRTRHLWSRQPPEWHRVQRIWYYSMPYDAGHSFNEWWGKYGETHPEYFALRGNTRAPHNDRAEYAKMCVSNPAVAAQWLENAEKILRENPDKAMISASPTDGPGFCTCENCRAWDHPDAPAGVLTDRYVRFWNILARGLKERFPDRKIYLGVMAYSAYSRPPLGEKLEDNIAVFHVGYFPLTTEESRREQKEQWLAWARMATLMVYRPNLWYWGGGIWGLPEVAMRKTIEDFRFLAENNCEGLIVDVIRHHWAAQGPQYYLLAQLAWDPLQDGEALLNDYYRRAFGPAAGEMEAYWNLMEQAHDALFEIPGFKLGSAARYHLVGLMPTAYNGELLARADEILRRADKAAGAGPEIYRRRVAFVRAGFEHTRLMMSAVPVMDRVRLGLGLDPAETRESAIRQLMKRAEEGSVGDAKAVMQAQAIWEQVERNAREAAPWAVSWGGLSAVMQGGYMGGMQLHFGPLPEKMVEAARKSAAETAVK